MSDQTELDSQRAEYVRQIIERVQNSNVDDDTVYTVDCLLMEWGGKAYSQGWNHAFDRIRKTMDDWKR
jgi:hypothetical protein